MSSRRKWISTKSSKSLIFLHIVLTTKYRRKVISKSILETVEATIKEAASELGVDVQEMNGEGDHIHMLVKIPATLAVTDFINRVKGRSSRVVRERHWDKVSKMLWGDHFWSPSYCVVSCGGAPLETVRAYIEEQDRPD